MANITTPVQAGGARSLPAEMKMPNALYARNALQRLRMQHPVNVRAAAGGASATGGSGLKIDPLTGGRLTPAPPAPGLVPLTGPITLDNGHVINAGYIGGGFVGGPNAGGGGPVIDPLWPPRTVPPTAHPPAYAKALGMGAMPSALSLAQDPRWRHKRVMLAGLGDGDIGQTVDTSSTDWVNPVTTDSSGNVLIGGIPVVSTPGYTIPFVDPASLVVGYDPASIAQSIAPYAPPSSLYSGSTTMPIGATTPTPPNGYQWAQLVNAAGNSITQVLAATRPGTSYTQLPNGTKIVYSQNPGYAVQPTGAGLSLTGSGLTAGISGTTLMMVAAVGLLFMMSRR